MKLKNKGWLIWLILAYGLCLLPSGCFSWFLTFIPGGAGGESSSSAGNLMEWAAHAILIAAVAYCLYPIFRSSKGWMVSLVVTIVLVAAVAWSIEWFQGLLPESFHRGFSGSDIWASLAGGLFGGIIATIKTGLVNAKSF